MAATTRRSPTAPMPHCGLEVTIVAGRPAGRPAGRCCSPARLDFYMGGNLLRAVRRRRSRACRWSSCRGDLPEGPAGHHRPIPARASTSSEDLKPSADQYIHERRGRRLDLSSSGWSTDLGFEDAASASPTPSTRRPSSPTRSRSQQGYVTSEPFAVEKARRLRAEPVPARRQRLRHLCDHRSRPCRTRSTSAPRS